jgi:hypothetical protein
MHSHNDVPGPGTYDHPGMRPTSAGAGPSFSFKGTGSIEDPGHMREGLPGPGAYDDAYLDKRRGGPSYSIGVKQGERIESSPGPGQYDHDRGRPTTSQQGYSMSHEQRDKYSKDYTPGPG